MQYLESMADEANKMVNSYRSNIMKGYKNRVRPEDLQEAQDDYSMGSSGSSKSPGSQQSGSAPSLQDLTLLRNRNVWRRSSNRLPRRLDNKLFLME